MKKILALVICLLLLLSAYASAETLTGKAKGFGGELTVAVTMDGETITSVEILENAETPSIAGEAFEKLPAAIVEANSADVDIVTGATFSSNAIIAAVKNAIDPEANPYETEATAEKAPVKGESLGLGTSFFGRLGPGKDSTETPVYSFNVVVAALHFDENGVIVNAYIDQLEVATPNYDGEGMPHFSGFPGQGGYNNDEAHDGTIASKTEDTDENFQAEVASWLTKRGRGDGYRMGAGTWYAQMDKFQELFVGKTVDEVEEWFATYTSDRNGRPLKAGSENEQDAAKYDALTDEEKEMLADVTSAATISLNDAHGNILEAMRNAYENRVAMN